LQRAQEGRRIWSACGLGNVSQRWSNSVGSSKTQFCLRRTLRKCEGSKRSLCTKSRLAFLVWIFCYISCWKTRGFWRLRLAFRFSGGSPLFRQNHVIANLRSYGQPAPEAAKIFNPFSLGHYFERWERSNSMCFEARASRVPFTDLASCNGNMQWSGADPDQHDLSVCPLFHSVL